MPYKAFISYSHATDGKLAPGLQSALQRFAKPWNQLRAMRVFVDKASLSVNPGLWSTIESALNESEYFILLASPSAAQSTWVQKEVAHWISHGRASQLLMVLTEGEIAWNSGEGDFDWNGTTALPLVLRGTMREQPLFVDLRWVRTQNQLSLQDPRFTDAVAGVAARLRGIPKDDLYGEHVSQHRKVVRLRRAAIATLAFLTVSALGATALAIRERNEALRQTKIAMGRELASRSESARLQRADLLPYSLILGVESMQVFPSVEADQAIRGGLAMLPRQVVAMQHHDHVHKLAVQPNGGRIATVSSDGTIRIWSADGNNQQRLAKGFGNFTSVVFSPNGKLLASADQEGVGVWDAESGAPKFAPLRVRGRTMRLAFSAEGELLAASNVAGALSNIAVWNAQSGELVKLIELQRGSEQASQGLAFSSDGRLAAAEYSLIRVWDTRNWNELAKPAMPPTALADLRFSPDGKYLAAGDKTGRLWVWGSTNPQPIKTLGLSGITEIAFSADGKFLAASGKSGEAKLWETENWTEAATVRHEAEITSLAFSPNGPWLATASVDHTAALWAIPSGQKRTSMDHGAAVNDVAFSPDGQYIVTASDDESARIWLAGTEVHAPEISGGTDDSSTTFASRGFVKLNSRDSLSVWSVPEFRLDVLALPESLRSAALSPNGELLATAGVGDIVRVQDVFAKRQVALLAHPDEINWQEYQRRFEKSGLPYRGPMETSIQKDRAGLEGTVELRGFSGDGRYLATTRQDFVAPVWDVAAQRVVASEPYEFSITASAFSPAGRFVVFVKDGTDLTVFDLPSGRKVMSTRAEGRFASVSTTGEVLAAVEEATPRISHGRVHLWRSSDWRMLPSFDLEEHSGEDVVLSPNGEFLAAGTGSTTIRVIRVQSGKEVARIRSEGIVNRLVFGPDNNLMAVAGADQSLRVWDLGRNHELARFPQNEAVLEVSFSLDGHHVAAGGPTLTRILSLPGGEEIARLAHGDPVRRIQFSPNGRYVATTGGNSTRIWLWNPSDLIEEACVRLSRGLSSTQWPSVVGEPLESRIARCCRAPESSAGSQRGAKGGDGLENSAK